MTYKLKQPLTEEQKKYIISSLKDEYDIKNITIDDSEIISEFNGKINYSEYLNALKNLLYIAESIGKEILFENNIKTSYSDNPMEYLLQSRDVVKIDRGMYLLQGNFLKAFKYFNTYFKTLSEKYNAVEQEYPVLWPVDLYRKINYFRDFPQQVILATGLKKDFKTRKKFADKYDIKNNYDSVSVDNGFSPIRYGLQSAVCDTCYYALSNETNYENKVYTTYNKVFRNEFSNIDSLDRLTNFSVRDIMFVGDKDFVFSIKEKLVNDLVAFLKEYEIQSRIESANDPFFGNDAVTKKVFQYSFKSKYELLARINFMKSSIAVGSINYHMDFFGKAFNITLKDGSPVHSGCVGIGFERLVYALYCQYGHDPANWPKGLKSKIGIS